MTAVVTATSPTHLMALFADRAAAGDVEGLLTMYEPDAVCEPQPGTVLRGTPQIREALSGFAAMRPTIEYAGQAGCVIVDDIALVSNTWTMTAHLAGARVHREGGVSADVLRRQADGSWLILIDQPRGGPAREHEPPARRGGAARAAHRRREPRRRPGAGAACRCARRVDTALHQERIRRGRLEFAGPAEAAAEHLDEVNDRVAGLHDAGQLLRALPATVPAKSRERITGLLAASGLDRL